MPKTALGMFLFSVPYQFFFQDFKMTTLMERFRIMREEKRVLVYLFFSYKKSFSSSSPLFIFRVAEFKSDFGDNPVEFMLGPLWWSRYSEYGYIYITSLMYTGLVWMATDKR